MEKIVLITLGCPKNVVEAESMAGLLAASGYTLTTDIGRADVAVVHTCSFISDARGESVQALQALVKLKEEGKLRKIAVTGCLVQDEGDKLVKRYPGVDRFVGTGQLGRLAELLRDGPVFAGGVPGGLLETRSARLLSSDLPSAYLRIAEGCGHRCSFCTIPRLRGKFRSRAAGAIVREARDLARRGIEELILVAQDTTWYGRDRYGTAALPSLLRSLASIGGIRWVRVMYAYPSTLTDEMLDVIRGEKAVCKYLDMPLQHASDTVLRRMRRPVGIRRLLEKVRRTVPDIALRTTFIVGFPGETEREFRTLAQLVDEGWFDHAGVFMYSPQPSTPSFSYGKQVPEDVKRERYRELMLRQQKVVERKNRERLGSTVDVLVEEVTAAGARGRSAFQAPEIDSGILLKGKVTKGSFVTARLTGVRGYDLIGKPL